MRNVVLAAASVALLGSSLLLTGCPGGCGAYNGAGDQVYARQQDSLIVCSNGGFVANVASGPIEGKLMDGVAVRGDTGALAFDLVQNADGTVTTPQLGNDAWQPKTMDKTALDHADIQCTDLTSRPWWASM